MHFLNLDLVFLLTTRQICTFVLVLLLVTEWVVGKRVRMDSHILNDSC